MSRLLRIVFSLDIDFDSNLVHCGCLCLSEDALNFQKLRSRVRVMATRTRTVAAQTLLSSAFIFSSQVARDR